MGWITKGLLAKKIEEHVWAAPLHQYSEIIQSAFGFHIVEVTGRRLSPFDEYEQSLYKRALVDQDAPPSAPDTAPSPSE